MSDKEPVAATHKHKFRYLLPPGNNFAFVAKFRIWLIISVLLMAASIGVLFVNKSVRGEYMNWTIDFKGGTEIIFAFKDKTTDQLRQGSIPARSARRSRSPVKPASRSARSPGRTTGHQIDGMIVRSARFSALKNEAENEGARRLHRRSSATRPGPPQATWSGDRMYTHARS